MVTLQQQGIEDLNHFAMDFMLAAGKKALSFYGTGDQETKFDTGLVTEAELRLSEYFEQQLHAHYPQHQIFKNDHGSQSYTHDGSRYLWIYDPLDGVANFQAGIPIWGGSLALLENFWPILGIFYMPATDDIFSARADGEAFWGERKIHTSSQETINDESVLLTYSRFHRRFNTTFPGKIRNLGCTAAHICYVAMGQAEAAIIDNESYQNLATAHVIVAAAGGKIFKMDASEFFFNEYLDGEVTDERLLVVAPDKYDQVREYLKEIQPAEVQPA
jgi:myo-inositol-1(or 4)-monophosphatase